jgi:probable F420-dependent oxidoreductase
MTDATGGGAPDDQSMTPTFRFGISLLEARSPSGWQARARQAEDLGFDVIQVSDHLGLPAPFPALVTAAQATPLRVGTYVLNAGVQNPRYLARDVITTQRLTGGRLELGLGTGYVEAEFTAAGVPFGSPGSRVSKLVSLLAETRELLAAEEDLPQPRIMIAGAGERTLGLAAREADIVSFPITVHLDGSTDPEKPLAARVAFVREAAGARFDDLELNLFVAVVGRSIDKVDFSGLTAVTGLPGERLAGLPAVLVGSPHQIAERLLRYREDYGVSYVSVLEDHADAFGEVIALLR